MREVTEQGPIIRSYMAEDGRTFRDKDKCERYEYLLNKWLGKYRESIDTEDKVVRYYLVKSFEEIKEVRDFEYLKFWNSLKVLPEYNYEFPSWIVCCYSPISNDYPEAIEPLSYMEECVQDIQNTINQINLDISNMKEILRVENHIH